ncbi:hypothetical protein [Neorhodopirellula lusitana]|uniref:hypothetical protein n=1 Tax=Neorhodopirellula lusitana TaxID=445327 RepID=UPI00384B9553
MSPHYIQIFLRVVGYVSLLAFAAAIMPEKWMVEIGAELGMEPFPDHPLTFYLARNLSLLYGFVGVVLLLVASDLVRYRPLVRWIAGGTIVFGVFQGIVDSMASMPGWWTYGESCSTLSGGLLLWWLDTRAGQAGRRDPENDAGQVEAPSKE